MAQTNYTPISLYYSATASNVPTAANLVPGELAINTADGKLYYEDSAGVVQVLATKSTGSIGGSTTQLQYNLSGSLAGSANMTFNGTTLTVNDLTDSSLTTGRVVYSTTGGNLTSSANLLYSGTDLTVYGLTVGRGAGAVASNVAVGANALNANTSGSANVAIGNLSGFSNQTGATNTYVGNRAGVSTTGSFNTFIGSGATDGAGAAITTGAKNTILGGYNGNQDSLDIRTASNYVVLSDGDGNRQITMAEGQTLALDSAVPNSGTGITFPATQSASSNANTLDDYEEGTWTPLQGTFDTWTSPTFSATYTKIGRLVTVFLSQQSGTVGWSASDYMGGLPFTVGTSLQAIGYAGDTTPVSDNGYILADSNSTLLFFNKANASEAALCFTISYQV
jgi:hypothetical protein